ncbi:MAG: NADH-quinone oxidoreductase subunit NuoK [Pseudomonadota bacterium]
MIGVPLDHAMILCGILFSLGLLGLMLRRTLIFMLMSLEIMLNSTAVAFVAAGSRWLQPDGQIMFVLILTLAAAEVTVGLALVLQIHQRFKTLDVEVLSQMKG